jgi:hypothetical protein
MKNHVWKGIWLCDFLKNCEYRKNLFFEIIFRWFRKLETKLEKNC